MNDDEDNRPYTVAELIADLQKLPPDMRVMVHGYEGGYHDAGGPVVKSIKLNVHTESYYGPHDEVGSFHPSMGDGEVVKAAII